MPRKPSPMLALLLALLLALSLDPAHGAEPPADTPTPPTAAAPSSPGSSSAEPALVTTLADLKARTRKIMELTVEGDATLRGAPTPVRVEFKDSPRMALLVANDLTRRGIQAGVEPVTAQATLRMDARISMTGPGGRLTFNLGTMLEKIMAGKSGAELAEVDPLTNAAFNARDYAVKRGLTRVGLFDPFQMRYFTIVSITDALGLHGSVNRWLTGDPRGICLANCDHWKDTMHWVIVDATVTTGSDEKKSRAVLKAWMKEVDPQTTFDIAYQALIEDRLLK